MCLLSGTLRGYLGVQPATIEELQTCILPSPRPLRTSRLSRGVTGLPSLGFGRVHRLFPVSLGVESRESQKAKGEDVPITSHRSENKQKNMPNCLMERSDANYCVSVHQLPEWEKWKLRLQRLKTAKESVLACVRHGLCIPNANKKTWYTADHAAKYSVWNLGCIRQPIRSATPRATS